MRQRLADYRVFWRQFRDAYTSTGAVLPSGPALCAALSHFVGGPDSTAVVNHNGKDLPAEHAARGRRILEVGPGTGAVTAQILRALGPADRLVLVERNEQFVAYLRERLPQIPEHAPARERIELVHSSVEDLPEDESFDLIISGLPLNNFSVALVEQILSKLRRLLAPQGTLSFFEYVAVRQAKAVISSPAERERLRGIARMLRQMLGESEIRRDLVLANVPPAWVHHVRRGGWGLDAANGEGGAA